MTRARPHSFRHAIRSLILALTLTLTLTLAVTGGLALTGARAPAEAAEDKAAGGLAAGDLAAGDLAAGDLAVERGAALSRELCAACHLVGEDARGASDAAPTFHAIANHPQMSERRIRGFVYAPHPQMPSLQLTEPQIDDIVAYLRSLEE